MYFRKFTSSSFRYLYLLQDGSRAQLIAGTEAVSYHKTALMSTSSSGDVFLTLPGQDSRHVIDRMHSVPFKSSHDNCFAVYENGQHR